jgi:RNA polymerase sigma-70 factor (ECF subfamily)
VANVHGPRAGIEAIETIPQREKLESNYLLHAVTGELHWRLNDHQSAAASFRRALSLANVGPEQDYLTRVLERVSETDPPSANETKVGTDDKRGDRTGDLTESRFGILMP